MAQEVEALLNQEDGATAAAVALQRAGWRCPPDAYLSLSHHLQASRASRETSTHAWLQHAWRCAMLVACEAHAPCMCHGSQAAQAQQRLQLPTPPPTVDAALAGALLCPSEYVLHGSARSPGQGEGRRGRARALSSTRGTKDGHAGSTPIRVLSLAAPACGAGGVDEARDGTLAGLLGVTAEALRAHHLHGRKAAQVGPGCLPPC